MDPKRSQKTIRESSPENIRRQQEPNVPQRTEVSNQGQINTSRSTGNNRLALPRLSLRTQIRLFIYFSIFTIIAMLIGRNYVIGLGHWGYLGAFIVSLISNASIILPTPGIAVIAMMTSDFNLLLLGLSSGVGGAIGATSSYVAGMITGEVVNDTRIYRASLRAMNRFGGAIIFVATLAPFLPMDAASILAGGIRYPFKRYFIVMGSAHIIKMIITTYLIANSTDWFTNSIRPFG
jgi:membrane protein YqaA with SNARE-associated domain